MTEILTIFLVFSRLGLMAFGGAVGVLPELQREVVLNHGWLSEAEFVQAYALGQLAPGPNMLMTFFVGYRVAGVPGSLAAGLGMFLPPGILVYFAARSWQRFSQTPWALACQRGLTPIAVGLMAAGVFTLALSGINDIRGVVFALVAAVLLLARRMNPAQIVLVAGVIGLLLPT